MRFLFSGRRMRHALVAVAACAVLVLTGCSASTTTPAEATPTDDAFPVTIEHAYGDTVIPQRPERVVVVGFKEQDYYLALGEVPVAIRDWYGDMPSATWPWAQDYLDGEEPVVLPRAELDYEQIIDLDPDVIVGVSAGLTEEEYDTLAKIAPTVAQPSADDDWAVTWQDLTLKAGAVLGKSAQAQALVDDLEAQLAAVAADYPGLDGASTVFASGWEGQYYLFSPASTASQLLLELGLVMSDEVTELTDNENQYFTISQERFDLLDVDVAVWSEAAGDDIMASLLSNPLYADLSVHQQGRDVFLGKEANGAFVFSSVLSLPYVLDTIVPALAAAVDGDTATSSTFSADVP